MMPAMRERPSAPPFEAFGFFRTSISASSINCAASGVTTIGATIAQRAALRRSRGSAPTIFAANAGSSLERI